MLNTFFASVFSKEKCDNIMNEEEASRSDDIILTDLMITQFQFKINYCV